MRTEWTEVMPVQTKLHLSGWIQRPALQSSFKVKRILPDQLENDNIDTNDRN